MGEHGTLRVSTELPKTRRPAERRRVAIKIQDTGRGIPIRYLERLFEPYFSLRPGGTGLGMCIAKRIVDDHNGTIAVESTEGVGTTVTIMLPVDRA
jgi:signal transduction histidine kinase